MKSYDWDRMADRNDEWYDKLYEFKPCIGCDCISEEQCERLTYNHECPMRRQAYGNRY